MKLENVTPSDPILVSTYLHNMKAACNGYGIREGADI